VKADFQKHKEETEERIKDVEATLARLPEELKERNSECKKL
jgi:ferritin-like metal-binding protein YciE